MLLDEGLTANGKPFLHHLMNEDLHKAYLLAREKARTKEAVTPELLREFNAAVMKSPGGPISGMAGNFDSGKGDFRLLNVTAGYKGRSYMAWEKVPAMTAQFCADLETALAQPGLDERRLYELSFGAHLNLVTIHPWRDGNGRTARLLMNYIQFCYSLVPVKVYNEDRKDYIKSLEKAQINNEVYPFQAFMAAELLKNLREEIDNYEAGQKKEVRLFKL
jgi:Fic family protein